MSELKRLGFVQETAVSATSLAGSVYSNARTLVPAFVEAYVAQLEDTAISVAAPYVTLAQDTAEKFLSATDDKVRSLRFVDRECAAGTAWAIYLP